MELKRGEIYYSPFPYTLDPKYPNGKPKVCSYRLYYLVGV